MLLKLNPKLQLLEIEYSMLILSYKILFQNQLQPSKLNRLELNLQWLTKDKTMLDIRKDKHIKIKEVNKIKDQVLCLISKELAKIKLKCKDKTINNILIKEVKCLLKTHM